MISYRYGLICENAIIDQQTNQLSILNVYDDFGYQGELPITVPSLTIVTGWSIEPDEVGQGRKTSVRFRFENGSESVNNIFANEYELVFEGQKRHMRLLYQLRGFPLESEGMHTFLIETKDGEEWQDAGKISFLVNKQLDPENVTTTSPEEAT